MSSQPTSMAGWTWAVTAPVLLLPWVLAKFVFWLFLWAVILTWRTVLALWALRFVPLIFIVVWAGGAPLQEGQKTALGVGQTVTECIDLLWNSGLKLVIQDLIWCLRSLCDLYNLVAEAFIIMARLVFDALGSLVDDIFKKRRRKREIRERDERFIFAGLPPDTPPPAFGVVEDICDIINDIIDILKDIILLVIGTVGSFVSGIIDGDIVVSDVFSLVGELLNFIFTDMFGIPCVDFANGVGGFIDGLEDCLSDAFDFVDDLAGCAGEANFTDFSGCVGGLKRRRRRSVYPSDNQRRETVAPPPRQNETLAQKWERAADWIGDRWMKSDVLPFAGQRHEIRSVGHASPPVYRTPPSGTTTSAQTMWISLATTVRNLIVVFSSTYLDYETFRIVSMPYREKLRALRAMNTDLAVRDFFASFGAYARERAQASPTSPLVANLHTMSSAIVTRLLAPHRLNATLEAFKKRGPSYAAAVKRVSNRLRVLESGDLTRIQRILSGRLHRRAAYKFAPTDFSPLRSEWENLRAKRGDDRRRPRGTIWDITDHLRYIGYADPESHLRREMEELVDHWAPSSNVTAWKERKRRDAERDAEQGDADFYSVVVVVAPEADPSSSGHRYMRTAAAAAPPQPRIPVFAIAKVFLKNPRFIVAAIVPFLSSAPGQLVIRRYLTLLTPIFGKYFSSGLTDLSAGDLLDFAEDFTEVTIDNLFYLTNVFLQFVMCSYWALILRGAAFILSFIPVIGFIFSTAANWALAGGAIMIGNCPPDPLVDSNDVPLQNPLQYLEDVLRCWETSVACSSSSDCPGGAACRCPNTIIQWHTFFWTVGPSSTTDNLGGCPTAEPPTSSGYCLCWPRLPCGQDTPFMGNLGLNFPTFGQSFNFSVFANETFGSDSPRLPDFNLSENFDVDCAKEYDYETDRIVWYKEANLIRLGWFNARNAYLGARYFSRDWIFSFPKINATIYTLLLIVPILFLILGNVRVAVIITAFITAIVFGMPLFGRLFERSVVPYLVRTENAIFFLTPVWRLMLDWMRFPNHSQADPMGSPGKGEGFCFVLNSFTFFGGTGLLVTLGIILYYFFFISIFLGILAFLFAVISAPFRVLLNIVTCYIFYSDAYDVHLSRRQGYYIEAEFTSGGGLGPEHTMREVSRFSPTGVVLTPPTSRGHRSSSSSVIRTKGVPYVTDPPSEDDGNDPTLMARIRTEVNPPTFRNVWDSVWEPLFRQPQASSHVTTSPHGSAPTIEEIPPQRKDV